MVEVYDLLIEVIVLVEFLFHVVEILTLDLGEDEDLDDAQEGVVGEVVGVGELEHLVYVAP